MRLRCLIVDSDSRLKNKFKTVMESIHGVQVSTENTFQEAIAVIQTQRPNLIILRCDPQNPMFERFFKLLERLNLHTVIIPLLSEFDENFIKTVIAHTSVVDVLMNDADSDRIKKAVGKASQKLFGNDNHSRYYRGFVGFVGITPSLRERKILQKKNLGIIHNKSVRLAIDFWRKNPGSQMVMLTLNKSDTFSSRDDELLESWADYNLEPWKIAMFEAQNHYLEYWKEAIASDLMPVTIPTILRSGINDLSPLPMDEQAQILVHIGSMRKSGQLDQALHSMGITFKLDTSVSVKEDFNRFTDRMEKQMKIVDERFPHLVRPPDETGYENFKPDVAEKNAMGDDKRMAFMQKKR